MNNLTVLDLIEFLSKLPPNMLVLSYNSLGVCDGSGFSPLQKDDLKVDFWDGVFDYECIEPPQLAVKLG